MISIQRLTKTFDKTVAVNSVDLQVESGQTVGLIGPNGSCKTTLLRMISTLAKPDKGSITIHGIDATHAPRTIRGMLSFMPAEFGFPKQMNIGEYMDYFACLAGIPYRQRRKTLNQVLELTDLKGRESESVRGLSTGNRQRLLLAKTLLGDPELLILDEPASGLDPRARTDVRMILKELAAMGKTIIISSHILADLQDICSHVCILEAGKLVLHGNVKELLTRKSATERVVQIELAPGDRERARQLISTLEGIDACAIRDELLEVVSHLENCNFILKALIDADLEILGMAEQRMNLEDVFLSSTKGVVT
jgi:ABC-2 type transport system ATP-binding protein